MAKRLLSIPPSVIRILGFTAVLAFFLIPLNRTAVSAGFSSGYRSDSAAAGAPVSAAPADSTPPAINVWYGNNQSFTLGAAQNWINILGGVADPESGVATLSYALNGSAYRALNMGPDGRRLARPGDFNIDIALSDAALQSGSNTVSIRAVNGAGLTALSSVQFTYTASKAWALPYSVTWNAVSDIQQAAQVVDGKWQVVPGGVRTVETGYDRVLAVGDLTWKDYEILVPVTINAIDSSRYGDPIGVDPGIGINLRWLGHSDDPVQCGQPKCGWNPTGASVWYEFFANSSQNNLSMQAYPPYDTPSNPISFVTGGKYWIRAHVETNGSGSLYKAKAWADGSPEPAWMFTKQTDLTNLNHGALLLVAHYVDATFGDVSVAPATAGMNQQITVSRHAPASAMYGGSFTVSASASSGLPVSYSSASPSVCTNNGSTFTVISASGTCVVRYDQPGNASYNPALQVTENTTAQKARQSITFTPIPGKTYGDSDFTLSASANSGLAVIFQAAGTCSVTAAVVSLTGAGSCAVTASQPGDAHYAPAADVTVTFTIAKAKATLLLGGLSQVYDGAPKPVTVTVSPANLTSISVVYNGASAAPVDAGSYIVTAVLSHANYTADPATGTLQVLKAKATLSLGNLFYVYDSTPKTASVTVSPPNLSGVMLTYDGSSTPPVAAGSYTVMATLADANYDAAPVTSALKIVKADQVITVTESAPAKAYLGSNFIVAAVSSIPGMAVAYRSGSPSVCINEGPVFTITGPSGTCMVLFNQAGNANYNAAPQISQEVAIKSRVFLPILQGP